MAVVYESTAVGERGYDLASRLLKDRIILVEGGVDERMAHEVCAQLQYLDSISSDPIRMQINSPGGSVHMGLAIADRMEQCRSIIQTECTGIAASMGCYLLAHGTPGYRYATRRANIMAHQVSSGTQGHISDQLISLKHTEALNTTLMGELAVFVGQDIEQFMFDCDRDKWMSAVEARDYGKLGFIDHVIGVDCGKIDERFASQYAKKGAAAVAAPAKKASARKPRVAKAK